MERRFPRLAHTFSIFIPVLLLIEVSSAPTLKILEEIKKDESVTCPVSKALYTSPYIRTCASKPYPTNAESKVDSTNLEIYLCLGFYDALHETCRLTEHRQDLNNATSIVSSIQNPMANQTRLLCKNISGITFTYKKTKPLLGNLINHLNNPDLCVVICLDLESGIRPLCTILAWLKDFNQVIKKVDDQLEDRKDVSHDIVTEKTAATKAAASINDDNQQNNKKHTNLNTAISSSLEPSETDNTIFETTRIGITKDEHISVKDPSNLTPSNVAGSKVTSNMINIPINNANLTAVSQSSHGYTHNIDDPKIKLKADPIANDAYDQKNKLNADPKANNTNDQKNKSTAKSILDDSDDQRNKPNKDPKPESTGNQKNMPNEDPKGDNTDDQKNNSNADPTVNDSDNQKNKPTADVKQIDTLEEIKPNTISPHTDDHSTASQDDYRDSAFDEPLEQTDQAGNQDENKVSEHAEPLPYLHNSRNEEDSHFFTYFTVISLICVAGYLGYHNKQKILAIVLEGRRSKSNRNRRRPSTTSYRKLDCILEEAVTSQCNTNVTRVIY